MKTEKLTFKALVPAFKTERKICKEVRQYFDEQNLKRQIIEKLPPFAKFIHKMKSLEGEIPSIIINAAGTGLVAPVFIKYNCLSKTDENTRSYSAIRQPIIGAVSVLFQCAITVPLNKFLSNMSNHGGFSDSMKNKTGFQDADFIKRNLKKQGLKDENLKNSTNHLQEEQLQSLLDYVNEHKKIGWQKGSKTIEIADNALEEILNSVIKDKKLIENFKNGTYKEQNFEIVKKYVSSVDKNIKGTKQVIGLIVNFALIPVSCTIMNKVFPIFANTFFPSLSKKQVATNTPQKTKEDK